jgi:xylulokinase
MAKKLLGIDVGTGGTRAALLDETGHLVSSATSEHAPIAAQQIGWAEQDPHDWWRATCAAVRQCLEHPSVRADEVAGIGLTGQMHGMVLLDAADEVLRPAIIWCDQRTEEQCRAITEKVGARRLIELTANPALTNFTLTKIWWVQQHEPAIWSRVETVLLPKDYVRFRLTGARACDVADASGTLLLDVANRRWSAAMMGVSQMRPEQLPDLFESTEVTGQVSKAVARATGLRAGTPVIAGAGDQAAGAVGTGIVRPGIVSATIGTSGVVFAATSAPTLDPRGRIHSFCHAVPGRWHVMGVTQSAGYSLRWFRDEFCGTPDGNRLSYDQLTTEAAGTNPGADGLLWLPYLMGERTPHLDPDARGALVGLTAQHTRGHVVRAILEGVAFSLRDTLTILRELNLPIEFIRLGGGGARNALWREIQADVYGMPVEILEAQEGAAYGAALLAGVGVGVWPSVEAASDTAVRVAERIEPDAGRTSVMNRRYDEYRGLYPALKESFHHANLA